MSSFHVGGWAVFYRGESPVSVYRVVKIDSGNVYLSGGACHNLDGSAVLNDANHFIKPISVETALEYVRQHCYIREEDKTILEGKNK